MPKQSIFRQPGAQHFQVVHRSQRDPLIHDPEASQQVLKPVERANDHGRKTATLSDLEAAVASSSSQPRINEGEAAGYGVYYDDSSYDYMQHLKQVGDEADGDAVMIPAPKVTQGNKANRKGKQPALDEDRFFKKPQQQPVLPQSVLPSGFEISREEVLAQQANVPRDLQGLQPDMDPHLRQVLEALEDEAFVDEQAEDEGWMNELLGGGELENGEQGDEWEFDEDGFEEEGEGQEQPHVDGHEETWEDRFRSFKAAGGLKVQQAPSADEGGYSEAGDTVGSLPALGVIGGKKRRKGASDASGYSMSSSSMFRNKGLSTLDEMFDKVERDYEREDEDEDDEAPDLEDMEDDMISNFSHASRASHASRLFTGSQAGGDDVEISREDFENIMDDFLDNYEVVGNRMVPTLGGETGADKLEIMRKALVGLDVEGNAEASSSKVGGTDAEAEYIRKRYLRDDVYQDEEEDEDAEPSWPAPPKPRDKWDAETILSTYSNMENHPRVIGTRPTRPRKEKVTAPVAEEDDEDNSGSETEMEDEEGHQRVTIARAKNESKEDKKARKASVKADRANRRTEKKTKQELFAGERRKQISTHAKRVGNGNAADVSASNNKIGVITLS